jgi:peptide/nickel transport system permease protein
LSSIPDILLIVAVMLMLDVYLDRQTGHTLLERGDLRLLLLCGVLGITSWTSLCRLLRGESLKLREVDYIQAAQSFGVRHLSIITRHILPNVMHIVLISIVLGFSGLVLAEAVLSYIGVGVDPSMNSWGNMINSARLEMAREPIVWWPLLAAFLFMFVLVLAANLFADAVRDAFDPRLRKR